MHNRAKICAALSAAFLCFPAAGQDPLADLFNRRGYDRDAILRQFPPDPPPGEIAPSENADSANDSGENNSGNTGGIAPAAPKFLPLRPQTPAAAADNIALVLPTLADGIAGQAAQNFYRGCLHGANAENGGAEISLYAFDGAETEAVRHYAAAVERGAAVIVGPMLKKNVRALLAEYPQTPSRTLLLQPANGEGYFVMSLDAAREAADLARLLYVHFGGTALIVQQPGARGEQLHSAFAREWTDAGGALPARFLVRNGDRDWARLFDMLKGDDEEEETTEKKPEAAVIFAAGNAAFAAKTRNFAPQRYPVFAPSTANAGARTDAALLLENLGFMEMPWFVGLDESLALLDSPSARTLPFVRQRFFALGADACRAAQRAPGWREGWGLRGLAGDWHLRGGIFVRAGRLSVYQSGRLRLL